MIRVQTIVTDIPSDFFQVFNRSMRFFVNRMSALAQRVAKSKAPKDTGLLINSIQIIQDFRAPVFAGGIETNVTYAVVAEEGRKPGSFPPIEPILRWVQRHSASFGIPGGAKGLQKAKGIAFLVGRKIARKGIKGNHFFRAAQQELFKRFGREADALGLKIQQAWESGG